MGGKRSRVFFFWNDDTTCAERSFPRGSAAAVVLGVCYTSALIVCIRLDDDCIHALRDALFFDMGWKDRS